MTNSINLGRDARGNDVFIDADSLIRTRALIQANSGGGKSFTIRRIVEQVFGKVQIIIVDPEGEFSTLREKFPFVLVGKGGETPADVRSADLVARRLLELNVSAVCDLYDMKPDDRHDWVARFLESMMNAPKELWHPVIVVVDEAHKFCPERGKGESVAKEGMVMLATAGRKRGFCPIFATQRVGKLDKDVAAELLNVMIGRTWLDIDRDRAAEMLGISKTNKADFFATIRNLSQGNFYCMGPAIGTEPVLVKVGTVQTTHPEVGVKSIAKTPPTPEQVKALLPKLADLPKEAEQKARTESELRQEIAQLKRDLSQRPVAEVPKVETVEVKVPILDDVTAEGIRSSVEHALRGAAEIATWAKDIREQIDSAASLCQQKRAPIAAPVPRPASRPAPARTNGSGPKPEGLTTAHVRILSRLAELIDCTGKDTIPKEQLAAWAEYSPTGGGYANYLGSLRSAGYLDYPQPGYVALTESGREVAQPDTLPADSQEMLERAQRVLGGSEGKLLEAIHARYPKSISKEELAGETGFSSNGGGFNNYLGHMRTLGFIDYPQKGHARAADWLFL